MSLESHIQSLKSRHRQLEEQLEELSAHPSVEDTELLAIKRKKLRIKDQLEQLKANGASH